MKKILIPPVLVLISLILILTFYFQLPEYNLIPFPYSLSGLVVVFFGFVIMGKARNLFSKYKTTFTFQKPTFLVTEGIFKKTRNPGYLGMFLVLIGVALCFRNIISLFAPFVFIILILLFYIPMEEKMLEDTFGQEYLSYKKNTKKLF